MNKLKTIELFSGTGSFSKVARFRGHDTFCVDKFKGLGQLDFQLDLSNEKQVFVFNRTFSPMYGLSFVWASPPCTTFSVASLGHHWKGGKGAYIPKTDKCKEGLEILENTVRTIACLQPTYWVIENPRGVMRKVIDKLFEKYGLVDVKHNTITYCSYGDNRMKPTDLWCNFDWKTKPMCKNYRYDKEGNIINKHCHHEGARRGARTGTQGLKDNKERSVIPPSIFEELFNTVEKLEGK